MADINPQTTFHLALTEKEYNLVMMGLALIGGATIKPDGRARHEASALNLQLLQRQQQLWAERSTATERKIEQAPVPTPVVGEKEGSA